MSSITSPFRRSTPVTIGILLSLVFAAAFAHQAPKRRSSAKPISEWVAYGRDPGGARYSPLTDINRGNVNQLKVAWTYRTGDVSDGKNARSTSAFQVTPLMVDGRSTSVRHSIE